MAPNIEKYFTFIWPAAVSWLQNFCDESRFNEDFRVYSPRFSTKLHEEELSWQLELSPRGNSGSVRKSGHMSLYLYFNKAPEQTFTPKVSCKFFLRIEDENAVETEWDTGTFTRPAIGLGSAKFCSQDLDDIKNGEFVYFGIVMKESDDSSTNRAEPESKPYLGDIIFEEVVVKRSENLADVVLLGEDGEKIYCNKCVLLANSPVFERMLLSEMKEKHESLAKIDDLTGAELLAFVHFVYKGYLPPNSEEYMHGLLYAADKYWVDNLKDACSVWMMSRLNTDNCIKFYLYAHEFNLDMVKIVAKEIIVDSFGKIMLHPDYEQLMENRVLRDVVLKSMFERSCKAK